MKLLSVFTFSFSLGAVGAQNSIRGLGNWQFAMEKNVGNDAMERSVGDDPELCSSHSKCSGLEGKCCPTVDGVFLDCCDDDDTKASNRQFGASAMCTAHPVCDALGLEGQCCPTTDGLNLDCCNQASRCSANSACAHLEGECCPTADGVILDCCLSNSAGPEERNVDTASVPKSTRQWGGLRTCSSNPVCNALGLEGDCCPSSDGVFLDCCAADASCSAHSACTELEGDCCPTPEGVLLDCCNQSCNANPACEHLEGACCPTTDGTYLDCCDYQPNVLPTQDTGATPRQPGGGVAVADFGSSCALNPVCALQGVEGECCPNADNVMLDCCNRECSAHTQCNGLDEQCCPSNDGINLECCDHEPKLAQIRSSCSAHSRCHGLDGACCPTTSGVFLDCC